MGRQAKKLKSRLEKKEIFEEYLNNFQLKNYAMDCTIFVLLKTWENYVIYKEMKLLAQP